VQFLDLFFGKDTELGAAIVNVIGTHVTYLHAWRELWGQLAD
jgi:hypothetical protein